MSSKDLFFGSFVNLINFIIIGRNKKDNEIIYYLKMLAIISGLKDKLTENEQIRIFLINLIDQSKNFQKLLNIDLNKVDNLKLDNIMKNIVNSNPINEEKFMDAYLLTLIGKNNDSVKINYQITQNFAIICELVKSLYFFIKIIQKDN